MHPATKYVRWLLQEDREAVYQELGLGGALSDDPGQTALSYAQRVGFGQGVGRFVEIVEDMSSELATEADRGEPGREKDSYREGY